LNNALLIYYYHVPLQSFLFWSEADDNGFSRLSKSAEHKTESGGTKNFEQS
jgi:hypothetical protein